MVLGLGKGGGKTTGRFGGEVFDKDEKKSGMSDVGLHGRSDADMERVRRVGAEHNNVWGGCHVGRAGASL